MKRERSRLMFVTDDEREVVDAYRKTKAAPPRLEPAANNNQIDEADYYKLPCGRQLEDFIWHRRISFAGGSALKYFYRAGQKFGEPKEKDMAKFMHFCGFISRRTGKGVDVIAARIKQICASAKRWDGVEE